MTKLPRELRDAKYDIEWFMTQRCGLQPFFDHDDSSRRAVIFEVCDWRQLNEIAAYGGFPTRYPHYLFALDFNRLVKGYEYGLSKIYEMVINNDPVYAYLLASNGLTDNKLVMAHVYAHADFFVNNDYFQGTNRKALEMMANHGVKIRQFQDEFGVDEVERWLDICLSLDNLVDIHRSAIKRQTDKKDNILEGEKEEEPGWDGRFNVSDYLDPFINPSEEVEAQKKHQDDEKERQADIEERQVIFPGEPERDVMGFLARYAPLKRWQREMLLMIRDEAYYFAPQRQTKIMNEGWAAYWHSQAMTAMCTSKEIIDYADHNSGTTAMGRGRLNPYLMGREIFRNIEWRWNTHRHGLIYLDCEEQAILDNWDQFVVFKNIYEEAGGDRELALEKWWEFLCFWQVIKGNQKKSFNAIYDPEKLLCWWHDYQTMDRQLVEIEWQLKKALAVVEDCRRVIQQIDAEGKGWQSKRRGYYYCQWKFQEDHMLAYCRGRKKFLEVFASIRDDFRRGKLLPENFLLPEIFWEYTAKFSGKLPIADGRRKIFEVRKHHCDLTFIDDFLTAEVCHQLKMFSFSYEEWSNYYEIESRELAMIKQRLCTQLFNGGEPLIQIPEGGGNFNGEGELLLEHLADSDLELDLGYVEATMNNLFEVWRRPVHLITVLDGDVTRLIYDEKGMNFEDE